MMNIEHLKVLGYRSGTFWYKRDNFFYHILKTRPTSILLTCVNKGCPARWLQKGNQNQLGLVSPGHNHEATPWMEARHPDVARHILFEEISSTLRKTRRLSRPAIPSGIVEYARSLAEHPRYALSVLAEISVADENAVVFGMHGYAECLRSADTLLADGTFATVPGVLRARQLLTLHVVVQGHYFHPVVAIMSGRGRRLYDAVLARVWQLAGQPRPVHIVADFEPALQGALQALNTGRVQGCFFHYYQALVRQARQIGLAARRETGGWRLLRLYAALALLPADRVPLALAELEQIASQNNMGWNENFAAYYSSYWINRVGPANFSVHGSPHRTSNICESFHASLKRSLGYNPNVWKFTGTKTF